MCSAQLDGHAFRAWRKRAQSASRRAVNDFVAARDAWQEAKLEGKAAAVEATNAYLQRLYLPDMQFGSLAQLNPGVARVADVALCRACEAAYNRLRAAASALQACADTLRRATEDAGTDSSPWSDPQPVFVFLTQPAIHGELAAGAALYEAEVRVKLAVCIGLRRLFDAASEARQQDVARSRDEVQVLLAAWILDVDLDEVRVASFLSGLSAEMKVV